MYQGHGLTYLKLAYYIYYNKLISFARASLWNSLPQNIKSCISLPCFKHDNLHKHTSENNLSSNLDEFVWITRLSKNLSVVNLYTFRPIHLMIYAHKRNLILLFLHICRNCETALIHCLIVLITFLRGIVVFICVCSTGWLLERSKWT